MELVVWNEATGNAVYEALGNPDVLRKILENFSHSELLGLSLVNKLWKEEARSLMLKRGNVVARFSCDQHHPSCMDLEGFSAALEGMKTIPFSTIIIQIGCKDYDHVCQAAAEDSFGAIDAILGKLAMVKVVSVNSVAPPLKIVNCTGVRLAENALQVLGANLDQLSLKASYYRQQIELMEKIVGNSILLNLKTLMLGGRYSLFSETQLNNFMKALISRAPNLVTFETKTTGSFPALGENIFEPKSNVVWLHHEGIHPPWECIPESIIPNLRCDVLYLKWPYWDPTFEFEVFNQKMPRILRSCYSTTLRTVDDLDAIFAVALMAYGICFENVDELQMNLDFRNLRKHEPAVLEIFKNFDFTRIFPRLTSVKVKNCYDGKLFGPLPDSYNRFLQLPLWREPRPDRAANITEILLRDEFGLTKRSARFFAQMFPAVKKIEVDDSEESDDIGLIGRHWPGLKELTIDYMFGIKNLDSIFCGVSPKEVALLREMDEGELKNLYIVPVKSAITCMKNLRALTIKFYGGNIPTAITMTNVTGLTAFSKLRCPNLEVTIQADPPTCQAVSYMAPFASIVPRDL